MSHPARLRRILVALDTSPASLAALEAAARVAANFGAELSGVYVEDEILIRGADLPLSRVVGSFSGVVRPIAKRDVEHQLRAQALRARHALESVAAQARVRWSFKVIRGSVTTLIGAAATDVDLISLGRRGWAPCERGMGRTTTTLLASEGAPVLLLDRGLRPGQSIVTIYDGEDGSSTALDFARLLSGNGQAPLTVVLRGDGDSFERLEKAARDELVALGVDRNVRFYRLGLSDSLRQVGLQQGGGIGILVLPGVRALGRGLSELLSELRCPVLVIRKPVQPRLS